MEIEKQKTKRNWHLTPLAKGGLIVAAISVLSLGTWIGYRAFNPAEVDEAGRPPELILRGSSLFQGAAVLDTGTLRWDEDDEADFDGLDCDDPILMENQVNYYYAEEDLAVMDIIEGMRKTAGNEVVVALYSSGSGRSGLDKGYYTYPEGFFKYYDSAGEVQDTIKMTVNQVIPAHMPFAVVLKEETEACGFKEVTDQPNETSPLPAADDYGWFLLMIDRCSDLEPIVGRVSKYFAQNGRNSFEEFDVENLINECTADDYYTAWAYFPNPDDVEETTGTYNVAVSYLPPLNSDGYNEIVDLLMLVNNIEEDAAIGLLEQARNSDLPLIISVNLEPDIAANLNARIRNAGGISAIDAYQDGDEIGDSDSSVRQTEDELSISQYQLSEGLLQNLTVTSLAQTAAGIDVDSDNFSKIDFTVELSKEAAVTALIADKEDLMLEIGVNTLDEQDLYERYAQILGFLFRGGLEEVAFGGQWFANGSWEIPDNEIADLESGTYVLILSASTLDREDDVDFLEFELVRGSGLSPSADHNPDLMSSQFIRWGGENVTENMDDDYFNVPISPLNTLVFHNYAPDAGLFTARILPSSITNCGGSDQENLDRYNTLNDTDLVYNYSTQAVSLDALVLPPLNNLTLSPTHGLAQVITNPRSAFAVDTTYSVFLKFVNAEDQFDIVCRRFRVTDADSTPAAGPGADPTPPADPDPNQDAEFSMISGTKYTTVNPASFFKDDLPAEVDFRFKTTNLEADDFRLTIKSPSGSDIFTDDFDDLGPNEGPNRVISWTPNSNQVTTSGLYEYEIAIKDSDEKITGNFDVIGENVPYFVPLDDLNFRLSELQSNPGWSTEDHDWFRVSNDDNSEEGIALEFATVYANQVRIELVRSDEDDLDNVVWHKDIVKGENEQEVIEWKEVITFAEMAADGLDENITYIPRVTHPIYQNTLGDMAVTLPEINFPNIEDKPAYASMTFREYFAAIRGALAASGQPYNFKALDNVESLFFLPHIQPTVFQIKFDLPQPSDNNGNGAASSTDDSTVEPAFVNAGYGQEYYIEQNSGSADLINQYINNGDDDSVLIGSGIKLTFKVNDFDVPDGTQLRAEVLLGSDVLQSININGSDRSYTLDIEKNDILRSTETNSPDDLSVRLFKDGIQIDQTQIYYRLRKYVSNNLENQLWVIRSE